MDLDLLQGFQASGATFKLAMLLAIACAYVLFELVLVAKRKGRRPPLATVDTPQDLTELAVEAYRPVTSWTPRAK